MTSRPPSLGRRLRAQTLESTFLDIEADAAASERFAAVDRLLGLVTQAIVRGNDEVIPTVSLASAPRELVTGLGQEDRRSLDELFALDRQRARGAWFHPETLRLRTGLMRLPFLFQRYTRYATAISMDEQAQVPPDHSGDALFLWALVEPLCETLFLPITMRGHRFGDQFSKNEVRGWTDVDVLASALHLDIADAVAPMRDAIRWLHTTADEQQERKVGYMRVLAEQATDAIGRRYRAYRLGQLLTRYYKKADSQGRARRDQVLRDDERRTIVGFFGGDWLAFIDYIGEDPHPEEHVATTAAEPTLFVGAARHVAKASARTGVPAAEVERMLAAFWQRDDTTSPVDERVDAMRAFWHDFDALHGRQRIGMRPLWGLAEEYSRFDGDDDTVNPKLYQPGLYRELLSPHLLRAIDRLWGTMVLPRWPDRIVTQPFAYAAFCGAFGPALRFWQGCALTAWYVVVGPMSRTPLPALARYHAHDIEVLAQAETPIDASLFDELTAADGRYEPFIHGGYTIHLGSGTWEETKPDVQRQARAFDEYRDIITRYRRAWAEQYLDAYLHALWDGEIRGAARTFNEIVAARGQPPTLKQFAKVATTSANHWFGGDSAALYQAFGEKIPVPVTRTVLMPVDMDTFTRELRHALDLASRHRIETLVVEAAADREGVERGRERDLATMVHMSVPYLQWWEAVGRAPSYKEVKDIAWEYVYRILGDDPEIAWRIFSDAVERLR